MEQVVIFLMLRLVQVEMYMSNITPSIWFTLSKVTISETTPTTQQPFQSAYAFCLLLKVTQMRSPSISPVMVA